jgi:hypothetical protein
MVLHGSIPLLSFEYQPGLETISESDNSGMNRRQQRRGGRNTNHGSFNNSINMMLLEDNMAMVLHGSMSSSFCSMDFMPALDTISEAESGDARASTRGSIISINSNKGHVAAPCH